MGAILDFSCPSGILSLKPRFEKVGAILNLPCPSVILWFCDLVIQSFRNLWNENFSLHFSQELWGLEDWNLVHTWTVDRCIVYTRIGLLLLIYPFISSFFFLSDFQTLKFFVTFFSGTVRPRRLKLCTVHTWTVGRCIVYTRIRLLLLIHPVISFFFLSSFQTLKFFVTLFSGTVRPRRWKISIHVGRCIVYTGLRLLLLIRPFISFFFLSNFQTVHFFVTLFSGTVRPRR